MYREMSPTRESRRSVLIIALLNLLSPPGAIVEYQPQFAAFISGVNFPTLRNDYITIWKSRVSMLFAKNDSATFTGPDYRFFVLRDVACACTFFLGTCGSKRALRVSRGSRKFSKFYKLRLRRGFVNFLWDFGVGGDIFYIFVFIFLFLIEFNML